LHLNIQFPLCSDAADAEVKRNLRMQRMAFWSRLRCRRYRVRNTYYTSSARARLRAGPVECRVSASWTEAKIKQIAFAAVAALTLGVWSAQAVWEPIGTPSTSAYHRLC